MSAPAETLVCYRHPRTETAVTCSDCERPICTDCMVFGPVGIRCPECAGRPTGVRKATAGVRSAAAEGGNTITKALIGVNAGVFLLELTQRGVIDEYALHGPSVAAGDWWRLLTSSFLHANAIHLLLNMLMLWWFGSPLEGLLGRGRFLGLYLVSALAGSAGALLLSPRALTVGASGAVFGILGAGLLLERRRIYVFGGAALMVVLFNLAFTFIASGPVNISIGGHLGGLAGGVLAMVALSRFGRGHAVYGRVGLAGVAGLVAVALVSVAIAYARVRGLA